MLLIPIDRIAEELVKHNMLLTGVIHFGAETCEELDTYKKVVNEKHLVWVEALGDKVDEAVSKGIKKVYRAVISDEIGERPFYRANNVGSSSILEFGTHSNYYPSIITISSTVEKTTTIDAFVRENNLNITKLNMWVLNLGGAEMMALKGGQKSLQYADAIYTKVHSEPLYKGCASIQEMDEFLNTKNFGRVLTATTQAGWGDALYIRRPINLPQLSQ